MKVCHLTSLHSPKDVRIFHKQCISLASNGYDVFLLAPNSENETINGLKIIGLKIPESGRIKRFFNASKIVYRQAIAIDADIYHFHDPELLPCGLKLRKKGKIVIYDAHEDVPRQILAKHWIRPIFRKVLSNCFERYENYVARRLSGIVASTPFIRIRFEKINPCTVEVKNFPESVFVNTRYSGRNKQLVYIGSISEIRGLTQVIEAIDISQTSLELAGSFSPESLKEKLENMSGWKNVNYHGFLNRTAISKLLEKCRIGMVTLHPVKNYLDSLPVKMFEYMAAGIPVIASNFPYWKEIIEKYNCGICVDPLNPLEIAKAIKKLVSNPEMAESMGKNGQAAIEDVFNWGNEEKNLLELYEEMKKGISNVDC